MDDEANIPVCLSEENEGIFVHMLRLPRTTFRDPFFIDSLRRLNILSEETDPKQDNEMLVRPLDLKDGDARISKVPLAEYLGSNTDDQRDLKLNFIFHMSRCGSTLITQMLATSERILVLSEPSIVNEILDPNLKITPEERSALLRATLVSFKKFAPNSTERIVVKFRSWNTLYLPKILKEFPETLWMFVHRNGTEVLMSDLASPPGWIRSKEQSAEYFAEFLGITSAEILSLSLEEYTARMLGAICSMAVANKSDKSIFIDYEDITTRLTNVLNNAWEMRFTEKELKDMFDRTRVYSKDVRGEQEFVSDSEIKRTRASEHERELAEQFIETQRRHLISIDREPYREFKPEKFT